MVLYYVVHRYSNIRLEMRSWFMNFPHQLLKNLGCAEHLLSKEHKTNSAPPAHHIYAVKILLVTQHRDRMVQVHLPYIKQEICLTTAILKFIKDAGLVPIEAPSFTIIKAGHQISPCQEYVRHQQHTQYFNKSSRFPC